MNKIKLKHLIFLILFTFTILSLLGLFLWFGRDFSSSDVYAVAHNNRSVNAYFMAIITSMSLIITLTSNLYSPRLVQLFVKHRLTIFGVSYIVITNFVLTLTHLISSDHILYRYLLFSAFSLTIIAMLGMIPFLYLISRFVKPSYFLPLMGENLNSSLKNLHKKELSLAKLKEYSHQYFSTIDVINNMASTAIQRKDRIVLYLVLKELFISLREMIKLQKEEQADKAWRNHAFAFTQGISEEGKFYLKKHKTWPEAYILSKIIENTNYLTKYDNEIVPFVCREITQANELANDIQNNDLIEILLMNLNALFKESLEDYNQAKFSIVTYYYRLNIEILINNLEMSDRAIDHFIFYGKNALKKNEEDAAKSFLFDLSRVTNYMAFEGDDRSKFFYKRYLRPLWSFYINSGGRYSSLAKQSIVKTYWTLFAQNYETLTQFIRNDFLQSNSEHANILENLLIYNRPLAREYTDTLICTEYLSGMARTLAKEFLVKYSDSELFIE